MIMKLNRIALPELQGKMFSETLLSTLELRDLRTTADLARSKNPDDLSWNRIVATTVPIVPDPVRKADGSPDLRYHSARLAAKAWSLKSLLKLLNRAVSCGNRINDRDYGDMIVYKDSYRRMSGRDVDAAFMLEFNYLPIYFRGGFKNFENGVTYLKSVMMDIDRS